MYKSVFDGMMPVYVYSHFKRFVNPKIADKLVEMVEQTNYMTLRHVALDLKSGSEARAELCELADRLEEIERMMRS